MESIVKLEEVCKNVLKDIKNIESSIKGRNMALEGLQFRHSALTKDIVDLNLKKKELEDKLSRMESDKQAEFAAIEKKLQERKDDLNAQLAKSLTKEQELDRQMKIANENKERYEQLASQYEQKVNDIKRKQDQLNKVLVGD